jgi:proline iminopeptidase
MELQFIRNMKKILLKVIKYGILLCTAIFLLVVFIPKTYNVPQLQKRASTQYWNLPTGSRIGYTLVPATGVMKPYPVIFLQGGPGGPIYNRNIQMLSPLTEDGYDVYLYDQIGCGFSNRLENIEDYTADRHKRDLEEIIKIIGAKKVILIGQSWGAVLAVLFIADNPDKIEKVIFTGPGPVFPLNKNLADIVPPDSLHLINPVATNADANNKANTLRTRFAAYFAQSFGIKLASDKEMDDFQTYQTGFNKATVCDTSKAPKAEAGGGFFSAVMTFNSLGGIKDPRPKLRDLKFPVLIIRGQCDNQKWGYIMEYLELFPVHQLTIIPDAGHSILIEQPELYLKTIRSFLNKETE